MQLRTADLHHYGKSITVWETSANSTFQLGFKEDLHAPGELVFSQT